MADFHEGQAVEVFISRKKKESRWHKAQIVICYPFLGEYAVRFPDGDGLIVKNDNIRPI